MHECSPGTNLANPFEGRSGQRVCLHAQVGAPRHSTTVLCDALRCRKGCSTHALG